VYSKLSYDPIFPATVLFGHMPNGNPLYSTPLQRSTVLACADKMEIRHPTSNTTWLPRYQNISQLLLPEWQSFGIKFSLYVVNRSILQSEYLEFRYERLGEYFDAPRHIHNFYSSPLQREQWKVEVKRTFNTRLALHQFHVRGIAQGLGHNLPSVQDTLRQQGMDARQRIIYPLPGWKNLKFAELMGFLSLCAALWITTVQIGDQLVFFWFLKDIVLTFLIYAAINWIFPMWRAIQDINFDDCNSYITTRLEFWNLKRKRRQR
jgi:hypothetical protein